MIQVAREKKKRNGHERRKYNGGSRSMHFYTDYILQKEKLGIPEEQVYLGSGWPQNLKVQKQE
jgi:hypothetical protein